MRERNLTRTQKQTRTLGRRSERSVKKELNKIKENSVGNYSEE